MGNIKRALLLIASVLAFSVCLAADFKPPGPSERSRAIGPTGGLPQPLQRAFDPTGDFEPIRSPQPGDWLAVHSETGQTFEDFARSKPNRPNQVRRKLYLQPLGAFPEGRSPSLDRLKEYAGSYFGMEVRVLAPLSLKEMSLTTRLNRYTGKRQILTGDVLAALKRGLPPDAFCVLAITMEDLYPEASWNFVFGQASLRERVGVYSFARYDPQFCGAQRGEDYQQVLLRRSCKVLVHEMAHMFGLAHCIFFQCVLNGSNHLQESDLRPLHLCPVCLRKLQHSIGFDIPDRYRRLCHFYQEVGFEDEAQWTLQRLKWILEGD